MGCFLGCFRIKDDGSRGCHLFSKSFPWKKRELIVSGNRYASVVSSEEKRTPSKKEEQGIFQENFDGDDSVELELRQEAKFLKTCGAILETPVEIRKASDKHSIVSDACCRKINMDQQLDKKSDLPSNVPETFPVDKCKSGRIEEYDDTTRKAVHFEEGKDSRVENGLVDSVALDISPQMENQMQPSGCESPYPTPQNLVAGMQTPGTVYPPKSETFRTGQIKVQFICPVSDLPQSSFESKAVCENRENRKKVPPASLSKEASSWWLKPPPPTWDEPETIMGVRKELSHSDSSSVVDRPIIGAAAAHWNGEEPSRVSPKQWDGNGIPNSTTKYKEDQRVSWHATPFEVRLEKALSDEKVYPHRKLDGRLMEVEDEDRE